MRILLNMDPREIILGRNRVRIKLFLYLKKYLCQVRGKVPRTGQVGMWVSKYSYYFLYFLSIFDILYQIFLKRRYKWLPLSQHSIICGFAPMLWGRCTNLNHFLSYYLSICVALFCSIVCELRWLHRIMRRKRLRDHNHEGLGKWWIKYVVIQ